MINKIGILSVIVILFLAVTLVISCSSSDDSSNNIDPRIICKNGLAGEFPCNNYDLMSHIELVDMSANSGNDSWGWTDPTTGKEYAIIGLDNGTAFIDVSDPISLIYLGKLPTASSSSAWRDIKVYNNFAFIVSEAENHGMQVFDLTKLRNVDNLPKTFSSDTEYKEFGNAHNIVINEQTGFAYAVGTNTFEGGAHFINIQDPKNPFPIGGYSSDGASHDAQVVTYTGPDNDYSGKEIYVGSNGNKIVIIDVSDKANPKKISSISNANVEFIHQGWFTENQQYFIAGDELDEIRQRINTKTLIFDFTDLDNPSILNTYSGPTAAIDHNAYVKDNLLYLANYTSGVRFVDISNNLFTESGFFDTYPQNNDTEFNGVWNVYPFFESGNIVISDISGGLFIVRKSGT